MHKRTRGGRYVVTIVRRYSALYAAVLLITVTVQMLDLGLCCEANIAALSTTEAEALLPADGSTGGDLLVPGEDFSRNERAAQPDCLCHLIFVSRGGAPALHPIIFRISAVTEAQESPYSSLLPPPGHIPIA